MAAALTWPRWAPRSRWLVWDPDWFSSKKLPAEAQAVLAREWDCDEGVRVQTGPLRLCPRR